MNRILWGCVLALLIAGPAFAEDTPANLIAGKKVPPDAKLNKGDKLVTFYEGKPYLVEIREVKDNKHVRLTWVSTGETDDDASLDVLYYIGNSTPTRKSRVSPLPEAYRAFDKNGDGQIALSEWDRAKYAEFRKLDKNNDGFLTPFELGGKPITAAKSTAGKDGSKELPAPTNLVEYKDKVDQSFTFKITAKAADDVVWGTGPYSIDSDLAAAVVHAGILKDGAAGSVTVVITAPVDNFMSSMANGVSSVERSEKGPAFSFKQ